MLVDRYGNTFQSLTNVEKNTGETFIDGKPIYIKTLRFDERGSSLNSWHKLSDLGLSNVNDIWIDESNSFVHIETSSYSGFQSVNTYTASNNYKRATISVADGLNLNSQDGNDINMAWIITIKYTKTTD